jgi:S-(hydroxymethyl)glutathione dehydrogenase/alcohol dehydrogenase
VAIEPGSTVAVIGCGGVGQGVLQGARIAGAGRIIAIDPVPFKREVATTLGATDVIDPGAVDLVEAVKELTGGRGADYAFEVTGSPEQLTNAVAAIRKGGAVIMVGLGGPAAHAEFPTHAFVMQQKRLLGSLMGVGYVRREYPRLISLVESGQLDVGAMVTKTIELDEINEGFDAMRAGTVIRSVIRF